MHAVYIDKKYIKNQSVLNDFHIDLSPANLWHGHFLVYIQVIDRAVF